MRGPSVPLGFRAAGVAAGVKKTGLDMALIAASRPGPAAAVFTTNRCPAASVLVNREHIADGRLQAVVMNSGNANAATGAGGIADAREMAKAAAAGLGCAPHDVAVFSTGFIGERLPMDRILDGVDALIGGLDAGADADEAAATAFMTTDTTPKLAAAAGPGFAVGGVAKGAGMIAPSMATMLCVVTTDAQVSADAATIALRRAADATFNRITVDGNRSTNDTVLLLSSGLAGPADATGLEEVLRPVLGALAEAIVRDGEGVTKFARIRVTGARDDADARLAADAVANSTLFKCSLWGCDPAWGRVYADLGMSGADVAPDRIAIAFNGVAACAGGEAAGTPHAALVAAMQPGDIEVDIDLDLGTGAAEVLTCDISPEYVRFNGRE